MGRKAGGIIFLIVILVKVIICYAMSFFLFYFIFMSFFQRLCSVPFPPVSCSFSEPHNVSSTIFWRDNQKIAGLGREILCNIQPLNPTHTDLGDAQTPIRGSQEVNLPWDLVFERLSHLIRQSQGSQKVVTPRPTQGPNSWEAVTPQPAQGFNL